MFNVDSIRNKNNKDLNKNWPYISDHRYRMLVIGESGSGKINALLNLIKEQYSAYIDDVDNNIDDYNPTRSRKIVIVFDDMIADIMTNKKFVISGEH